MLISLLGILGAVAAPRFLSVLELNAAQAHRQALTDLRFAQQLAMLSGCPVQVDFQGTGYRLTRRTGCRTGAFTQPVVDPVTHEADYVVTLPSSLTVASSIDPLVFDSMGRAATSGGIVSDATITVAGSALEAIGETGLVRVP